MVIRPDTATQFVGGEVRLVAVVAMLCAGVCLVITTRQPTLTPEERAGLGAIGEDKLQEEREKSERAEVLKITWDALDVFSKSDKVEKESGVEDYLSACVRAQEEYAMRRKRDGEIPAAKWFASALSKTKTPQQIVDEARRERWGGRSFP